MVMWRRIAAFPNYSVSTEGEIRNDKRDRIVQPSYSRYGHARVNLYHEGYRVCRSVNKLVLEAFRSKPTPQPNVTYIPMHLNDNPEDCRLDNLTWAPRVVVYESTRQARKNRHESYYN